MQSCDKVVFEELFEILLLALLFMLLILQKESFLDFKMHVQLLEFLQIAEIFMLLLFS
jgi:hypothetical protein